VIFDELLTGTSLFVDASPLVYYFAADPVFGPACGFPGTCKRGKVPAASPISL
jgi:hypothetical protein